MEKGTRTRLACGAAALCLAAFGAAAADHAMTKDAYRAAKERIEVQARIDRKACDRLNGNAKDVCKAQAEGREKVARAQLEARRDPSPEAQRRAKEVQADAEYAIAKQRCEAVPDSARDACLDRAKGAREAAERLAAVEKVEAERALARNEGQPRDPRKDTPQAHYAAQKAFCTMQGPDRDRCLADLNRRFHKES